MRSSFEVLRGYVGEWDETLGVDFYTHQAALAALTQIEAELAQAQKTLMLSYPDDWHYYSLDEEDTEELRRRWVGDLYNALTETEES